MSSIRARRVRSPWALCLGAALAFTLSSTRPSLAAEEAGGQPAAPAEKLDLDRCIELGLQYQPALAAARASLAAAQSGSQALGNLPRVAKLVRRDMRIRQEQSCEGIVIASAGLTQAEFETRYAVQRMFYSVKYARMQKEVVDSAVGKIERAHKQALKLIDLGDPKLKVTKIDADTLEINLQFFKTKQAEANVGVMKALAGMREAIGVGLEFPLELSDQPLPALVSDLNKEELISQAQANRAELQQAMSMNRVTELEIAAQRRQLFSLQSQTFAAGGDIHAKPIPQGVANGEYRPGAIGPEMPPFLFGKRADRVQRAGDFNDRASAVVGKAENLIVLEVEFTYLKWLEAAQNVANLAKTPKMAFDVEGNVRKRFDEGNATGEEYLRARTLVDQSNAMYNQAVFEHALALAALERVTAGGYRVPSGK